ncbi:hypothetical protein BC332_32134 [Capsicum chinense]|nr:hypothetical protein BC332_32134 [Capsicum chinense]
MIKTMAGAEQFNELPEDCISTILSLTSPKDTISFSLVSSFLQSVTASDFIWETFSPSDYNQIIDKSVTPLNYSSKKELFVRLCNSILLDGGNNVLKVAELKVIKLWTSILSAKTKYGICLIMKISDGAFGLSSVPVEISLEIGNRKEVHMAFLDHRNSERELLPERLPCKRGDGWMEIELGELFNGGYDDDDEEEVREFKGDGERKELAHSLRLSREVEVESKTAELISKDLKGQDPFPSGSPPEDIPLLLPQEADCDEEVSFADEKLTGLVSSLLLKFDLFAVSMLSLGLTIFFSDDIYHLDLQSQMKTHQLDNWWDTQERVAEVVSTDEIEDVGPRTHCHCQFLWQIFCHRSAGTTQTEDSIHKAYCSLIGEAEHFVFIEVRCQSFVFIEYVVVYSEACSRLNGGPF